MRTRYSPHVTPTAELVPLQRRGVSPAPRPRAEARLGVRLPYDDVVELEALRLRHRLRLIAVICAAVAVVAALAAWVLVSRSHDAAHRAIEQAKYANASWNDGFAAKAVADDAMRLLLMFGAVALLIGWVRSKAGGSK